MSTDIQSLVTDSAGATPSHAAPPPSDTQLSTLIKPDLSDTTSLASLPETPTTFESYWSDKLPWLAWDVPKKDNASSRNPTAKVHELSSLSSDNEDDDDDEIERDFDLLFPLDYNEDLQDSLEVPFTSEPWQLPVPAVQPSPPKNTETSNRMTSDDLDEDIFCPFQPSGASPLRRRDSVERRDIYELGSLWPSALPSTNVFSSLDGFSPFIFYQTSTPSMISPPRRSSWNDNTLSETSPHFSWSFGTRRHSVADPSQVYRLPRTFEHSRRLTGHFPLTTTTNAKDTQVYDRQCQQGLDQEILDHIDEYFGGTRSHTTPSSTIAAETSCQGMGKGIPLRHFADTNTVLYKVAFNDIRSEICYVMEENMDLKVGDWVVVEADRGRDLGKVVANDLTAAQVAAELDNTNTDAHCSCPQDSSPSITRVSQKGIQVKHLYRLATPAEIATLATKKQDEAKALAVCRMKLKQKGLAMEVVNAEYQWDRRKLTFYFAADQRVDFRELVRELFKTYKTRIWMCAVKPTNTSPVSSPNTERD